MITSRIPLGRIPGLLQRAPEIARPMMSTFVRDSARTLISSSGKVPGLVQVTPPHSEGKRGLDARRQGDNAVMGDIWQVYATPGKLYEIVKAYGGREIAAQYWAILKNRPDKLKRWLDLEAPDAVRRMLRGFDGGRRHMESRDRRGRVRGRQSVIISEDEIREVRAYIKRRQANVGLLAASIPVAYNGRFGPLRGVPGWVRRHAGSWAPGFVFERPGRQGEVITIGLNARPFERDLQRRFNYVLGYRLNAMKRQLPFIARSIERRLDAQLANA